MAEEDRGTELGSPVSPDGQTLRQCETCGDRFFSSDGELECWRCLAAWSSGPV